MVLWYVFKGFRFWMKILFFKKYLYYYWMELGRCDWCCMLLKWNSIELGSGYVIKVNLCYWVIIGFYE